MMDRDALIELMMTADPQYIVGRETCGFILAAIEPVIRADERARITRGGWLPAALPCFHGEHDQ